MSDNDDQRFNRLENKVDKLIDVVTELVSIKSDINNIDKRLNSHADGIKQLDSRIDTIEKKIPIYDLFTNTAKWMASIVTAFVIIGLLGSWLVFGG
jgi:conjugal transfer/entry exclusion protein